MEENQNQEQIPNSDEFNFAGNGKKKKRMGPVKGLFLAIVIVLLICIIGLLVRMVMAGDGDFFKPIKDIFGIEGEETEKKKSPETKEDDITPVVTSGRYTLLSDAVNEEGVKHYRLTVDMGDIMNYAMDELQTTNSLYDQTANIEFNEDMYNTNPYSSEDLTNSIGSVMSMMQEIFKLVDGEMYLDVYFVENEIVQVVVGFDYYETAENLYDYIVDLDDEDTLEEMKHEGIESAEDFADYIQENLAEYLDEDALYDELMENEETAEGFKTLGLKEKDIKDAIDVVNQSGLVEFYINGTDKMSVVISAALNSEDFKEELATIEDEEDYEFDEDNLIESLLLYCNESDEYKDLDLEFVEVDE